jgi:hypothetical protein
MENADGRGNQARHGGSDRIRGNCLGAAYGRDFYDPCGYIYEIKATTRDFR